MVCALTQVRVKRDKRQQPSDPSEGKRGRLLRGTSLAPPVHAAAALLSGAMVRRRRLAAELRRLREAAHLTCEEAAARLECSASKISRIETGRVSVSPRDVRDLLRIYGVPEEERSSLIELARESRQKGWWQGYGDTVEPHLATYLGMESEATEIRHYNPGRIPTLLQTRDYADALITAGRTGIGKYPGPPDRMVDMLLERQRRAMARPPSMWVVLDEAALRRQVGGPEVMRRQIEHLIGLTSTKTVFLQFVPFSSGAYVSMDLPFVILAFPDPADPDVVCIGYQTGVLWIEELAEVDRYSVFFHHLQAAALSLEDSVALMTSVLKDMVKDI
jgi:transcriptional regulator with XRE-family HTH domain